MTSQVKCGRRKSGTVGVVSAAPELELDAASLARVPSTCCSLPASSCGSAASSAPPIESARASALSCDQPPELRAPRWCGSPETFARLHLFRRSLGAVVDEIRDGGVAPVLQDPGQVVFGRSFRVARSAHVLRSTSRGTAAGSNSTSTFRSGACSGASRAPPANPASSAAPPRGASPPTDSPAKVPRRTLARRGAPHQFHRRRATPRRRRPVDEG